MTCNTEKYTGVLRQCTQKSTAFQRMIGGLFIVVYLERTVERSTEDLFQNERFYLQNYIKCARLVKLAMKELSPISSAIDRNKNVFYL